MTNDSGNFLGEAEASAGAQRLYDANVDERGFVMNLSRVWAHQPEVFEGLSALLGQVAESGALTFRQRAVLIAACASTLGDSYCSLAWGARLAGEAGDDTAGAVLRGDDAGLDPSEQALARWARQVARDPNGTTAADVATLRDAGFDDRQILSITAFVALRLAFSTVNDALGAAPDATLVEQAPAPVRDAVTFGRGR